MVRFAELPGVKLDAKGVWQCTDIALSENIEQPHVGTGTRTSFSAIDYQHLEA